MDLTGRGLPWLSSATLAAYHSLMLTLRSGDAWWHEPAQLRNCEIDARYSIILCRDERSLQLTLR